MWFNAAPIGDPNSAFSRPAKSGRSATCRGTSFGARPTGALDASLFKKFRVANDQELEVRIESVNFFNHVNLGNPDSEIGVPGNNNTNAGRITSTAYGNTDPQRQLQIGSGIF